MCFLYTRLHFCAMLHLLIPRQWLIVSTIPSCRDACKQLSRHAPTDTTLLHGRSSELTLCEFAMQRNPEDANWWHSAKSSCSGQGCLVPYGIPVKQPPRLHWIMVSQVPTLSLLSRLRRTRSTGVHQLSVVPEWWLGLRTVDARPLQRSITKGEGL